MLDFSKNASQNWKRICSTFYLKNQNAPYMCTKFEYKILDKVTPCIKFKTDFGQIRSTFHTQTKHSIWMVTVKRHLNNYWTEITQICRNSQSSRGVLQKRYSWTFCKIHRKHLCQNLFFNLDKCFPVNFAKFLGTPFL